MLAQEIQRPMEFNHPPLLVRNVSARKTVREITFTEHRKIKRSLYGIGMPIEIYFRKPTEARVEKQPMNKRLIASLSTKNTQFLDSPVEDF